MAIQDHINYIYIYKHSIGMKGKSIKTHSLYIHLAMLLWTKFQTIVPFRSLPKWYHSMSVYWYSLSVYCLNELWQFIISKQFTKHTFNHLNGVFDSYSHCSISYKFSVIFYVKSYRHQKKSCQIFYLFLRIINY